MNQLEWLRRVAPRHDGDVTCGCRVLVTAVCIRSFYRVVEVWNLFTVQIARPHSSSISVPSTAVNGSGNVEALIASYWIGTFTYQLSSPDVLELTVGTVGTVGRSSDDACSGLLANKSSNGHHHSAG